MKHIIITEIHLAARLFRSGILKYFGKGELMLYITDICYNHKSHHISNDKTMAKAMIEQGILNVVELNETEVKRIMELHEKYKPKFVMKTLSALVYAERHNLRIVSEDELLREISNELGIKAYDKEWLVTNIVHEISAMGTNLDLELVKEII